MFRDRMDQLYRDSALSKKKLTQYQERVRSAIELIDGKNISRAKTLLKVDGEYIRRTL